MFIKSAVILTTLFTAYYYCFYGFTSFLVRTAAGRRQLLLLGPRASGAGADVFSPPAAQACLFCAVVVGAMKAEIGVSIMHDANHGGPPA